MKSTTIFFLVSFILFGCTNSVNSQDEDKNVTMLIKDFYLAYHKAWAKKSDPNVLMSELDSLHKVYCTVNLRNELKKLFKNQGLDHDIFTNDYGTDDESMKTIRVTKNPANSNSYIVSYVVNTEDPSNTKVKEKVIVYLAVKKENGIYKINDVK